MNSISFKNLKFFRDKAVSVKRKPEGSPDSKNDKGLRFWQKLIRSPFPYLILMVIVIAYSTSYIPSPTLPLLEEGEIAPEDIVAPSDLTIEDKETTEKRRQEAMEVVLPVYNFDQNVFLNTEEKIRQFFNSGREMIQQTVTAQRMEDFKKAVLETYGFELSTRDIRALVRARFPVSYEENLINLIAKVLDQGVILKNLLIHGEEQKGIVLIRDTDPERTVKVNDLLDINEAKESLSDEVRQLGLPSAERTLLTSLSNHFISTNITFNNLVTEARRQQASENIETVFYTIKKGKVIIRKGDEVSRDILKEITIINQNISDKPSWLTNFAGIMLLFGLLFITLWYYLKSILRPREDFRNFLMMGMTLILSLLIYKLSLFLADTFSESSRLSLLGYAEAYRYAFPYQFGTLVFAFLTRIHLALVFTVVNSLLVGFLIQPNVYLMFFALIGGFAAIYGIKYYGKQKRTSTIRAGLVLVSTVNIFLIFTFHLIRERIGPLDLFASEIIMGLLGGILSASLAFLFLPVFEHLFSIVTQTRLLELTNSDLPILRKMAIEAPGSYHHSLIVAALAENAAEELRLDSMLVKAGALYHDIGKIKMPEYFVENRAKNSDMHKALKPSMSTLVIINHIKEGLEIAKKLRLPRKLREIIEQHHGDNLVKYFYEKAKEEYDPEMQKIREESYRYPGPKPSNKEAALVMLADSIEAAARSLKSPTKANLRKVITDIFNNYIQDGQLDDCDFSIKELRTIADSFLATLDSIYHHRIEYPGFEFEVAKKKKNNKTKTTNDRNSESSA